MSECQDISEKLLDWIEGELSGAEQARLAAHLEGCAACKDEVKLLQAVTRGVAELPELAAPAGVEKRIMARVRQAAGGRREASAPRAGWLSWLQLRPLQAAGALAAVLVAVGVFSFLGRGDGRAPVQVAVSSGVKLEIGGGTAQVEGASASAGMEIGEGWLLEVSDDFRGKLLYPDGSWVRIRPGSTLRVYRRSLGLQDGDVWLKVTKGGAGFQVETPQAVVAVRGTVFGVGYDPDASETRVEVEEGSVEVSTSGDRLLVESGQLARVSVDLKVRRQEASEVFGLDREDFLGKPRRRAP